MAYSLTTRIPSQVTPADEDFVLGKAKDVTEDDAQDGTPFDADFVNNFILGWQSALLKEAGISPDGTNESGAASQIVQAMKVLAGEAIGLGMPINSAIPLNSVDNIHTSKDLTVWIKTGIVSSDLAAYPDATVTNGNVGIANAAIDTDTGLPIYIRIK